MDFYLLLISIIYWKISISISQYAAKNPGVNSSNCHFFLFTLGKYCFTDFISAPAPLPTKKTIHVWICGLASWNPPIPHDSAMRKCLTREIWQGEVALVKSREITRGTAHFGPKWRERMMAVAYTMYTRYISHRLPDSGSNFGWKLWKKS